MRHEADRRVDHAGGTAGVRPFGAAEVAAMSAPRPARVWPTACGGSAPPGAWPAPRSTP